MTTSYVLCALFTLISAGVSFGYSVMSVRAPAIEARYALVRSTTLLVLPIVALTGDRPDWLVAAAVVLVLIQAGDAVVGLGTRDRIKIIGPAVTALVNLALLVVYLTS